MKKVSNRPPRIAQKQDIKKTAFLLMKKNGQTTTLEVKKHLRTRGFHVRQIIVSRCMDEAAAEEMWYYTCNGTFRTYSLTLPGEGAQSDLLRICWN